MNRVPPITKMRLAGVSAPPHRARWLGGRARHARPPPHARRLNGSRQGREAQGVGARASASAFCASALRRTAGKPGSGPCQGPCLSRRATQGCAKGANYRAALGLEAKALK